MNRAIFFDVVQAIGLAILAAGLWAQCGPAIAAIAVGAGLIVLPIIEIELLRRRG
jgi:hypothetical protein